MTETNSNLPVVPPRGGEPRDRTPFYDYDHAALHARYLDQVLEPGRDWPENLPSDLDMAWYLIRGLVEGHIDQRDGGHSSGRPCAEYTDAVLAIDQVVMRARGTLIEQVAALIGVPPGDLMRALDVCPAHVAHALGYEPQGSKVRSAATVLDVDQFELREALALAPAKLRAMFDLEPNDPLAQAKAQEMEQRFRDAASGQPTWLEQGQRLAELPGLPVTEVAAGDRLVFILSDPGALPGVVAKLAHADRSRQPMVFLDHDVIEQVLHLRAGAEATVQEPAAESQVPPVYQRLAKLAQVMAGAWKLAGDGVFADHLCAEDLDRYADEVSTLIAALVNVKADAEDREQFRDAAVTLARLARGGESPFRVGEVADEVLRLAGVTDAA